MRSFSKAIAFLLAFDATTSIDFTTRRETGKFSKKNEALRVCTYHNFVGSSKYVNCRDIETEIKIECGDEDADDTTRMCKVTEHPWNNEQKEDDTDASAAACVVHGSFDPNTHITTDSATGLCHLEFLSLLDSCDASAGGSPSGVFGMKAEIHNSRHTDLNDNSGLLLRFSRTGGTVFYNDDDPRETVPLHGIIPAHRKLQSTCGDICETSVGTYESDKDYCYACWDETGSETGSGGHSAEYCWNSQNQCPPKCDTGPIRGVTGQADGDCGKPCDDFKYTRVTSVYDPSRDYCYKEKNVDRYCWFLPNSCWSHTDGLLSGNWEGTGGRPYNNCGRKCDTVYDPTRDYCYKVINVDQYCWYPTDGLPSGNWEGKSGRAYNNCGPKCDTMSDE